MTSINMYKHFFIILILGGNQKFGNQNTVSMFVIESAKLINEKIINIHDSKRVPLSAKQRDLIKGDIPYYGATSIMGYVNDYIFVTSFDEIVKIKDIIETILNK